jgi:hypothetical protein
MAASTYTPTTAEQANIQRYMKHVYRSQPWLQLVGLFQRLDQEYGVAGGANGGTNDALAPHSFNLSTGVVSVDAADAIAQHAYPFHP